MNTQGNRRQKNGHALKSGANAEQPLPSGEIARAHARATGQPSLEVELAALLEGVQRIREEDVSYDAMASVINKLYEFGPRLRAQAKESLTRSGHRMTPLPIDRQSLHSRVRMHADLIASSATTLGRLLASVGASASTAPSDLDPENLMRLAAQIRSVCVTATVGLHEITSHAGHLEAIGAIVQESERDEPIEGPSLVAELSALLEDVHRLREEDISLDAMADVLNRLHELGPRLKTSLKHAAANETEVPEQTEAEPDELCEVHRLPDSTAPLVALRAKAPTLAALIERKAFLDKLAAHDALSELRQLGVEL